MGEADTNVSKVVERVMSAARKRRASPDQVKEIMNRVYPEKKVGAVNPKDARTPQIIEDAKKVYKDMKATGMHATQQEWAKAHRIVRPDADPKIAFKIAQQDLRVALKAAKIPPTSWIARQAETVRSAEAAQALTIVALAPKEAQESPHFLFQTAAQLAASEGWSDAQPTVKAFMSEMMNMKGKDGFDAEMLDLYQMIQGEGMGHVPGPPPPNFDPAVIGVLPPDAQAIFSTLNTELLAAHTDDEKHIILRSYSKHIDDLDSTVYTPAQVAALANLLRKKEGLERLTAPTRGYSRDYFRSKFGITPVGEGDFDARYLNQDQIDTLSLPEDEEGESGIDKYIHTKMRQIFSGSREPRSPDLQDQSELWEIEQFYRYLVGVEKAQPKITELRTHWEAEYRRKAINWHLVRGGANAKDLITKYAESIPTDTLIHESKEVLWGPEAITAYEQAHFEIATEKGFIFDQGRRWFAQPSATAPGMTRLEAHIEHRLTGAEAAEAIEWDKKTAYGSGVIDLDALVNEPESNKVAKLHSQIDRAYLHAKEANPHLTEANFWITFSADPHNADVVASLRKAWREVTLFDNPEDFIGTKLWNTEILSKWQGFSPLQIRAMIKLEAMLRDKGVQHMETKGWKLARAMSAAHQYQVGSLRAITLTHKLENMVGLLGNPGGSDVMIALWQEQIGRHENPDVFIRRFSMQTENYGLAIWANHIIDELEKIGVKLERGDRIVPAQNEHETFELMKARTLLLKSRKYFGMRYTETIRQQLTGDFSAFDDTSWRNERAVWWELQEKYKAHAKNVGMGIQLQLSESEDHYGSHGTRGYLNRSEIWRTIAERTPSKLFHLLSTERTDTALESEGFVTNGQLNTEWKKFTSVLSAAERRITRDDAIITNDTFSLRDRATFDTVFDHQLFESCGITNPADQTALRDKYFRIISQFQHTFLEEGPGDGKTYRDIWAKTKMAITVSMVDFDPKLAAWEKLPADQQLRRAVSDGGAHLASSEAIIQIFTKPEYSLSPNEKKLMEMYHELKSSLNGYMDTNRAERIILDVDDARVSFLASKDFYKKIRVIPWMPTFFRALRNLDTGEKAPWLPRNFARLVRPGLNLIANSPIFVRDAEERRVFKQILSRPIKEWPMSFSQLFLSGPIGAVGGSGVALDSLDLDKHYHEMEHSGLIVKNHERMHRSKDRFRVGFFGRLRDVGQRYWWIPIVATIAVGVMIASKEQGLEGEGKSH